MNILRLVAYILTRTSLFTIYLPLLVDDGFPTMTFYLITSNDIHHTYVAIFIVEVYTL